MKQIWLRFILSHPWAVLLLSLVLIALTSMGGKNLTFNGDYKVYFEKDNPQRVAFEQMQGVFNKNETANILIAPKQGSVFNPTTLTLLANMTDAAWQTPLSSRIDSIANYQYSWSKDDDMIVEQLITDPELLDEKSISRMEQIVLSEPSLRNRLVSADGQVAMIAVTVNLPDGDKSAANAQIAEFLHALTDEYRQAYPNHNFYHTGIVFMNIAFEEEAKRDAQTLVPGMFLMIMVVLWILLRSINATIATLLIVATTIASTMGIAGWMGFKLTTALVNVPTLVMTLAVADCVHIIATALHEMGQGKNKNDAVVSSMKLNLKPVFITSLTTAIGFIMLNFSNVPALAELGTVTAIGVMIAFLLSVTFLPALMLLLPFKVKVQQESDVSGFLRFSHWVIRHHRAIMPVTLLAAALTLFASTFNKINDVPLDYFHESAPFKQAADFQTEMLGGMSTIDFALLTDQDSGLNKPEILQLVEDFSQWLRQQPEVDHVDSVADVFKRLNKNMHGDDPSYYRLPENQDMAAQFLLLYEMSLPYKLDLTNQINLDKSGTRIAVTMKNLGSKEFTEFEDRAQAWVTQHSNDVRLIAGSQNLMFAHIGEANMNSMLKGTVLALVLISLILVFALQSWRLGAISLLPNLLPAAFGFGIWGLYSGEINMGLSVVLSMALGIIVDDTVHYLTKYQNARKAGKSAEQAVNYSFTSVGKALFITTIVLTLGFSVLTLSSFALNSDMGLLTGIIIVSALVVDFFFLPAFLLMFDKKDYAKGAKI